MAPGTKAGEFTLLEKRPTNSDVVELQQPTKTLKQLFSSQTINLSIENGTEQENVTEVDVVQQERELVFKDVKRMPLQEIQHQLRLKLMKREFFNFIDSVLTEHVDMACKLHCDALIQYDDELVMFEKVKCVRQGELRPEELNMTQEEVDEYQEPKRPHPKDHFEEAMEL